MVRRTTTIQIDEDLWDYLNQYRRRGMSFNDVLEDLLGLEEEPFEDEDTEYPDDEDWLDEIDAEDADV